MQAFSYLQSVDKKDNLPRLIVTDLYLPGITGAEFLKDLKGMDKYKHIHVIVLTSTKTERQIEEMKQMGAADYLIKPSSYEEYLKVAQEIKDKHVQQAWKTAFLSYIYPSLFILPQLLAILPVLYLRL